MRPEFMSTPQNTHIVSLLANNDTRRAVLISGIHIVWASPLETSIAQKPGPGVALTQYQKQLQNHNKIISASEQQCGRFAVCTPDGRNPFTRCICSESVEERVHADLPATWTRTRLVGGWPGHTLYQCYAIGIVVHVNCELSLSAVIHNHSS